MAAKYDFKTSPDIQGEKEQPTLYPQIVVSGTKNLKDLAKDIARRSTVHEGTVVGLCLFVTIPRDGCNAVRVDCSRTFRMFHDISDRLDNAEKLPDIVRPVTDSFGKEFFS